MPEWTCPHGTTYTGSDDFIGGARNAHDEIANRGAAADAEHRSVNDIAQEIIDLAPEAEPLVEEWFAATGRRLNERHALYFECQGLREALLLARDEMGDPGESDPAPVDRSHVRAIITAALSRKGAGS